MFSRKRYKISDLRYSIKNFKPINNESSMNIKPITVYCGVNSSGKSSIIQSLLLVSQSIFRQYLSIGEERIKIPQIFIFEGNKCHLQDYKNIIYENNLQNKLEFKWDFKHKNKRIRLEITCCFLPQETNISRGFPFVESVVIRENENEIEQIIKFNLMKKLVPLYELNTSNLKLKFDKYVSEKFYFPYLFLEDLESEDEEEQKSIELDIISEKLVKLSDNYRKIIYHLEKLLENLTLKNVRIEFRSIFPVFTHFQKSQINELINSSKFDELWSIFDEIPKEEQIEISKFKKILIDIINNQLSRYLNDILRTCVRPLDYLYSRIRYIGPLREEPKRFYTFSDLRLLDLGLKGENTTQVLTIQRDMKIPFIRIKEEKDKISFIERKAVSLLSGLNEWLEIMNLQKIIPTRSMKLITRMLVLYSKNQPKDSPTSLPDVGFGLSQILPVLVEGLRMISGEFLILEQPEIHLHPRLQGDLADFILCNAKLGKNFMIETHSEHFLKRLCLRIAQFKEEDISKLISIYFVVPNVNKLGTKVVEIKIDEFGRILNWPKGFLDGSEDALLLRASILKEKIKKEKAN